MFIGLEGASQSKKALEGVPKKIEKQQHRRKFQKIKYIEIYFKNVKCKQQQQKYFFK